MMNGWKINGVEKRISFPYSTTNYIVMLILFFELYIIIIRAYSQRTAHSVHKWFFVDQFQLFLLFFLSFHRHVCFSKLTVEVHQRLLCQFIWEIHSLYRLKTRWSFCIGIFSLVFFLLFLITQKKRRKWNVQKKTMLHRRVFILY